MTKKKYQKPGMQVYPLMKHAPLICDNGGSGGSGGSGAAGYIPRVNADMNELA